MHLTNYSIQKKAKNYNKNCKWNLHGLRVYLLLKLGRDRVEYLFSLIQEIIINTLLAAQNTIINENNCFELYGYDVLIDSTLKPWLIEVNSAPSLTGSDDEDYKMKYSILNDLIDIIDLEGERTGSEIRIGGFDKVFFKGKFIPKQLQFVDRNLPLKFALSSMLRYCKMGCNYEESEIVEMK
eukprot:snap_masked-scaffold_15-processed-gene-2.45-mRNA-1 protein AED:0.57 eAED:0.57 QI:0/-1/0/1/-1/1/1/0/181